MIAIVFICIWICSFFFGAFATQTTAEFVNGYGFPIEVIDASNERIVHELDALMCNGVYTSRGHRFCARRKGTKEILSCRVMESNHPQVILFESEEMCGFDLGDVAGVCTKAPTSGMILADKRQIAALTPYAEHSREDNEATRLRDCQQQPNAVRHFTKEGVKKLKVPRHAWDILYRFYKENFHRQVPENWPASSSYVNHWEHHTYMIHLAHTVKETLFNAIKPILLNWAGIPMNLNPTSAYGIRLYKNDSFLRNHVDVVRTHVLSAIIHIDSDVDSDWPLEIVNHEGIIERYRMEPGDLMLYESASILHGRPERVNGSYYANCFIHFQPDSKEIWDPPIVHGVHTPFVLKEKYGRKSSDRKKDEEKYEDLL